MWHRKNCSKKNKWQSTQDYILRTIINTQKEENVVKNVVLKTLHLFAGAGGGILADQILGHRVIGAVESEPYPRKVLLARQLDGTFPEFPIWDDVRTFSIGNQDTRGYIEYLRERREELAICGGFP